MAVNKKHPGDVGLSYFAHLKFAWNEAKEAWCISIVMFVHGLLPWVWDWQFNKYLDEAKKRVAPQHKVRKKKLREQLKIALYQALIVLVPTYLVAFLTDKMVYTIPMLAAASFVAASLSKNNMERKVEEDGFRKDDGPQDG